MANRLVKFALVLLAVTAVSLVLPQAAYADCTATASGSLSPGAKSELTCDGTTASAAGTLMNGSSPACGKLTLWDLNANVLVDRQTGCSGSLSVSGMSVSGYSTSWLTVLTNQDTNTVTYTHYIAVSP